MGYTLGEAAKHVGKSKATISKAIKSGKLSATKNMHGAFDIDPSELTRVYPAKQVTVDENQNSTPNSTLQHLELNTKIRELEIELKAEREKNELLTEHKDSIEAKYSTLEQKLLQAEPKKRGFWPWSRG